MSARPTAHPDLIAWIDVETTGLDENDDFLLEIAAIVTDHTLEPVDDGISVVINPECPEDKSTAFWMARMSEFVVEMHVSSGLLDELTSSPA